MILIKSGALKKEAAKIFEVRANTVSSWVRSYKLNGLKGLEDVKRGVKSEDKKLLNLKQEKAIQKMILDTMPDQLKLPYALWTRKAVKELIEREFPIVLAITTTGNYLRSWDIPLKNLKRKLTSKTQKRYRNG